MSAGGEEGEESTAEGNTVEPIKIGDFARLAGTNLRTLRYYEEQGLLRPFTRSAGGFRYYRAGDLDRLRMIAGLQRMGLELARIRELVDTRDEGCSREEFHARVRSALERQRALVATRMAELAAHGQALERALAKLSECTHCDHRPTRHNNFCHPCQIDGQALPENLSALF